MRKSLFAALVVISITFGNGMAFAASEDLSFDVGIKSWVNSMKLTFGESPNTDKYKSDNTVVMVGPSARMTYKKFFTGLSVLTTSATSDYEYKLGAATPQLEINRDDVDLLVGVMFVPQFGIVTGYKGIFMDYKFNDGTKTKVDKNGGLLGVTSNYALPFEAVRVAFYGNLAYLFEQEKVTDATPGSTNTSSINHSYQGYALEAGVAYNIIAGLSVNAGYKIQELTSIKKTDETADDVIKENYQGLTLGVNYRF